MTTKNLHREGCAQTEGRSSVWAPYKIKPSIFSLSFLCSWIVLYSPCVIPDVTPDNSATGVSILNGVPVVQIVAPTKGGVSHNTFTTFNVGTEGIIINNSRYDGISALPGVGTVTANPNFGGGPSSSASIILNEVTSTSRSSLLGTTEIFGDNASYILANPNGITCNGCGFIRTPTAIGDLGGLREVLLSTADITLLSKSDLESLEISINSPADIVIGPLGLNVNNVDVTTLFTRKLNINGLISASNSRLQMLLGTGTLAFDDPQPEARTFTSSQSDDGAVTVAIDASVAGAMNAGQIYIMATEDGVGVTLDNDLIASAGDVELTASGDIVYRNVNASDSFNVTTNGIGSTLTAAGTTIAGNDVNWNLSDNAEIDTVSDASITATNNINISCASGNCDVNAQDHLTITAAQLNSDANITTAVGSNLTLNADVVSNADITSGNNLTANTGQLLAKDVTAAVAIQLTSETINIANVNAGSTVNMASTGSTSTNNITADGTVTITAATLETNNLQTGDAVSITTSGNTTTADINALSNVTINAASLVTDDIQTSAALLINTAGSVSIANINAQNIDIDAAIINAANIISSNNARLTTRVGDITTGGITTTNNLVINTLGNNADLITTGINSGGDISWQLNGQAELEGNVIASNNINFDCATPDCTVNANDTIQFNAENLNTQANIQTANSRDLIINANLQTSADIKSGNHLQINAVTGDILSSGSLSANQNIELNSAVGGNVDIAGTITTGADFIIGGDGNYNHNSRDNLSVAGNWIIDAYSLTNNDTIVTSDLQNGVFRVNEFHNNGLFQSDGTLILQVDDLLNNSGIISSLEGTVNINHSQLEGNTGTINNNGIIRGISLSQQQQPENTLIINPQSIIDDYIADILAGKQRTAKDLVDNINQANLDSVAELTAGNDSFGTLRINADTINNAVGAQISATQLELNVAALNNQGGLIAAAENITIYGESLNNSNGADVFGVISARDNVDIILGNKFDNEGVIEGADIVIDAPIQNNNSSQLVLSSLTGQNLSTASNLSTTASQLWFDKVQGGNSYYQYRKALDNNPLIDSNLSQLTDEFLVASSADLNNQLIVGDDVFLSELIANTIRENSDLPFVTNDRSNLSQLNTLYRNTLAFMDQTNLSFGQLPTATQRQKMKVPIVVFQQQNLANGDFVYTPTILLPNVELNTNALAAGQLNSRIQARNELLLRSENITNSGDLIAGNNLIIDTVDLTLTTTERNWFVNSEGEVEYHSAMISSPSMTVSVRGDYVQKGGQLVTNSPVIIQAENVDISGIDIATNVNGSSESITRTANAVIESPDALYLIAKQRLNIGKNSQLSSVGDTVLSAGKGLTFNGSVQSAQNLTLTAKKISVGGNKQPNETSLLAQGNILLQSETNIDLGYADITSNAIQSALPENGLAKNLSENTRTGGITLLAGDGYINSNNTTLNTNADIYLSASKDINSNGTSLSANSVYQQAENINLLKANIASIEDTSLVASNNISVKNSNIDSNNINLFAENGNISINKSQANAAGDITVIAQQGDIVNAFSSLTSQGDITQQANSINVANSTISNISGAGTTNLLADNNLITKNSTINSGDLNLFAENGNITIDQSKLTANGDMVLKADNHVLLTNSKVRAETNIEKDNVANAVVAASDEITKSGNLIILAEKGNIVNTTGTLSAENSGYMKAGGNIVNRATQTVQNKATKYSQVKNTSEKRVDDNDDDSTYTVTTNTTTKTTVSGQYVKAKSASINTGDGGLTQIAGGDILNAGGNVRSSGDIFQQADGSIKNTTLVKRFIDKKTTVDVATTTIKNKGWSRRNNTGRTTNKSATQTIGGIATLSANTQAGGNVTQIAGSDIINNMANVRAGEDLYQQAKGNIKNLSADLSTYNTDTVSIDAPLASKGWNNAFRARKQLANKPVKQLTLSNTYVANKQLISSNSSAGGSLIADADGNYVNTGNLSAGNDINISAENIINKRLTRSLANAKSVSKDERGGWWGSLNKNTTTTTTSGRKQVLDTGRVTAGGNIILNADNKIIDTAGRYTAGTRATETDKGGIYANAKNGIDLNAIKWTERDSVDKTSVRFRYDNDSEDRKRVVTTNNIGYNTRDKIVTGNLSSAGHTSLTSDSGDLNLSGTTINAGEQIALQGRNINLKAIQKKNETYYKEGRTVKRDYTIRNQVTNLNAQEGLSLVTTGDKHTGNGNLTTYGAKLNAGTDAADNIIMNITGNTNLAGVNDEDYSYYYNKRKRSFGRSKTTIIENRNVSLNETAINAGGNLLTNVEMDDAGQLVGLNSGTVTLEGTNINVGKNAVIYGEEGVNVLSGVEYSYARKETHKSGFGGFSKSGSTNIEEAQRLGHAEITSGGDTVLLSKDNVNVVAGKLNANNITADAGFGLTDAERATAKSVGKANVNIIGDKEALASLEHKYDKGLTFNVKDNFLSLAEETHEKDWEKSETYVGSVLNAREDITLRAASDVNVVGSQLTANNNINIDANRDLNILSGVSNIRKKHEEETTRFGISVSPTDGGFEVFAGAETVKTGTEENQALNQGAFAGGDSDSQLSGSVLLANNINLTSGEHTSIAGSVIATWAQDINAANDNNAGNISIDTGGKLITQAVINNNDLNEYEERLRVGIKLTAQENVGGAKDAVDNAGQGDNAVSKVASTLRAIDAVQGANSSPVSGSAGIVAEYESSETNSNNTTSHASILNASNNLTLRSGDDQIHTGTLANAGNNLSVESGGDLLIESTQNTTTGDSSTRSVKAMYGLGEGSPVSGSLAYSESDNRSNTQQNAQFTAGNLLALNVDGDTTLQGASAKGKHIEADLKGDLTLTSLQDTSKLSSENASVSLSRSGGDNSFGISGGKTKADKAWVSEQTALIATDSATVKVQGHTQINGAIINSEANNLQLETETLAYTDIRDHDDYESTQANIGFSTSQSSAASSQTGTSDPANNSQQKVNSAGLQYQTINKEQINRATIGQGTIIVRSDVEGEDSTQGINRDINKAQEITKDESDGLDLYYSDSSADVIGSTLGLDGYDGNTLMNVLNPENILAGIVSNTVVGLDQIENAFTDAVTLNGVTGEYDNSDDKGLINTSDAKELASDISANIKGVTSAVKVYTNKEGELRFVGQDTDFEQRVGAIKEGEKVTEVLADQADTLNNLLKQDADGVTASLETAANTVTRATGGNNVDVNLYTSDADHLAANADGYNIHNDTGGNDQLGLNTNKTNLGRGSDVIAKVTHELNHGNGGSEATAYLAESEASYQWRTDNRLLNRQSSGGSTEEWNKANQSTLQANNQALQTQNPALMEFRQLNYQEANIMDQARVQIGALDVSNEAKQFLSGTLEASACARVRCAAHVSPEDPEYAKLKQLQDYGDALDPTYLNTLMTNLDVDTKYDVKVTGQASRNGKTRKKQGFEYGIGQGLADSTQSLVGDKIHTAQESIKGTYEFTVFAGAEAINKVLQTEDSEGFAQHMANQVNNTWSNAGTSPTGENTLNSFSTENWQAGQSIIAELAAIGLELVPVLKPVKAVKDLAELGNKVTKGGKSLDDIKRLDTETVKTPNSNNQTTVTDASDTDTFGQLEPGNPRSTSLPRNDDVLVLNQGTLFPTCGPTACAMVLDSHGKPFDLNDLILDSNLGEKGAHIEDFAAALKFQGLDTARVQRGVKLRELADATSNGHPAIVGTNLDRGGHAIVVDSITTVDGQLMVAIRDPALGRQYYTPVEEFAERYSGQVVFTNPTSKTSAANVNSNYRAPETGSNVTPSYAAPIDVKSVPALAPGKGVFNSSKNLDTPNTEGKLAQDSKFFTKKTEYQAPEKGTGQNYTVYQQNIDWNLKYKGKTNLDRAREGGSPYVMKNGKPAQINLHHSRQDARGSLFEVTNVTHRAKLAKGGKGLHPYGKNQHPNYPVNRKAFDVDRNQYWIDRAKNVEK